MANEITVSIALALANGSLRDNVSYLSDQVNQSANELLRKVVNIPTTAGGTVISTSEVTTLGYMYVVNLDPTNFVKYGPTSGGSIVDFGKLKPGEHAVLRLMTGISLRFIADTAACDVLVVVYND
jgi:hypothetical protein